MPSVINFKYYVFTKRFTFKDRLFDRLYLILMKSIEPCCGLIKTDEIQRCITMASTASGFYRFLTSSGSTDTGTSLTDYV